MHLPKILVTSLHDFPSASLEGRILGVRIRPLSFMAQVDFYSLRDELTGHTERIDAYFRVFRVPSSSPSVLQRIGALQRAVKRQLESEDYAVIHIRSPWEVQPILDYDEYIDSVVVYEVPLVPYGIYDDVSLRGEYDKLQHRALRRAQVIVVSNVYTYEYLKEVYGSKVHFIPVGVRLDSFDRYGLAPLYDVVWNVDITDPDRLEFMLEVFRKASELKDDLSILITGRFSRFFDEMLVDRIRALSLRDVVKSMKITRVERMGFMISMAKVGILEPPADGLAHVWSDTSLKAFEYLASGVPALVPDCPFMDINRTGLADQYDPLDSEGTAQHLVWLLHHRDETAWRVKKAYESIRTAHDAGQSRRSFMALYRDILGGEMEIDASGRDTVPSSISWEIPLDDGTPISDIETLDINLDDLNFEADAPLFAPGSWTDNGNDRKP